MDNKRFTAICVVIAVACMTALTIMMVINSDSKVNIGKSFVSLENGRLTPEALWSMGRIGEVSVSPDGTRAVYQVTYYSVKENASHTVIYVMDVDGGNVRLLTKTAVSEHSPAWIGNEHIAFLSAKVCLEQADAYYNRQTACDRKRLCCDPYNSGLGRSNGSDRNLRS